MDKPYIVYGQKSSGSVPVEAALLLLGEPYEVVERIPEDDPAQPGMTAEAMARVNPMRQVPALVLPDDELMTESAAILIHLADSHPASRLSPAVHDPRRPAFLRWMTFVSAEIYGLVWVRDDPGRLAADDAHKAVILEAYGGTQGILLADNGRSGEPRPLHTGRGPDGSSIYTWR